MFKDFIDIFLRLYLIKKLMRSIQKDLKELKDIDDTHCKLCPNRRGENRECLPRNRRCIWYVED
jgi:hypothetical protein